MPQTTAVEAREDGAGPSCRPFSYAELTRPVDVGDDVPGPGAFWTWPLFGPMLFENEASDARDHCANERTFLSYLRLSIYMAIVSVALVLSFHLKSKPSPLELKMARPLGFIFWILSISCLMVGFGNYMQTVRKYSRKAAIVQSGWKTQSVMSLIAIAIVGTCVVLLVITKLEEGTASGLGPVKMMLQQVSFNS